MDRNQPITTYKRVFWTLVPLDWVTKAKNVNHSCIFLTCGRMLSLSAAEAKKLLIDDKITACVKQICLVDVVCKVSNRKALSCETLYFSEKHLPSTLYFVLRATSCFFTSCWLAPNQLFWNVLLFSCNLIGQFRLSGVGHSSRTVMFEWQKEK